ncbi:MAG: hypothetical protein ABIH23_24310 [bacterium]
MANLGKYNATKESHTSTLFSYGEVPVASSKLNYWNGNIEASLEVINRVLSRLANRDSNTVLDLGSGDSLHVRPQPTPNMTVRILPGLAVIHPYVAGRTTTTTLPQEGMIEAPKVAPRIDVVYLQQDGEVGLVTGVEGLPTVAPSIPDNAMALAQIHFRLGCTSILETDDTVNAYLSDVRPLVTVGATHQHANDLFPTEPVNGSTICFSTVKKFQTETLDVFLNGVLQTIIIDYTENSDGRGYTFVQPPPAGATIQHRYIVDRD